MAKLTLQQEIDKHNRESSAKVGWKISLLEDWAAILLIILVAIFFADIAQQLFHKLF